MDKPGSILHSLRQLRDRNILQDIDLELCRFLLAEGYDVSPNVVLAVCLVSYLYRQGDVCLQLENYADQAVFAESGETPGIQAPEVDLWRKKLLNSPIVGSPEDFKPLILDKTGRLYLHKLWHYEVILAEQLLEKAGKQITNVNVARLNDSLARLFPQDEWEEINWQKVAAANTVRNKFSIISGGPGTGKTSTVVRVLALLLEQSEERGNELNIALAAPTGKAAARLKDSIISARDSINVSEEIRSQIPEETMTLHQLLGARRLTSAFKHHANNPVLYDVVVVDEASMVDQTLMSKLMQALLKDTQLILIGDKNQLASVEAGSVLGDICDVDQNRFSEDTTSWLKELSLNVTDSYISKTPKPLTDNITLLTKSYRFNQQSGIAQLAEMVKEGDAAKALQILKSSDFDKTNLDSISELSDLEEVLRSTIVNFFKNVIDSNSVDQALNIFDNFRILAAHRRGPWGVQYLNQIIERILREDGYISKYDQWYAGKPVIINVNDYTLGLHNGDSGVCLPDEEGALKIYFRHENAIRTIDPARLPNHSTAFALTVHKSQGSEFEGLLLILPESPSKVLTRELLYTAVTRARTSISILGNEIVIRQTIKNKMQRFSGLRNRLWNA